ncbi:MAG: hypothetical protein RL068_711 [Actinomycetota bacterium]
MILITHFGLAVNAQGVALSDKCADRNTRTHRLKACLVAGVCEQRNDIAINDLIAKNNFSCFWGNNRVPERDPKVNSAVARTVLMNRSPVFLDELLFKEGCDFSPDSAWLRPRKTASYYQGYEGDYLQHLTSFIGLGFPHHVG